MIMNDLTGDPQLTGEATSLEQQLADATSDLSHAKAWALCFHQVMVRAARGSSSVMTFFADS